MDNNNTILGLLSELTKSMTAESLLAEIIQAEISNVILNARLQRKMTQTQFAQFMGVTQAQVSKWEKGEINFTVQKLAEIAVKLDLEMRCPIATNRVIRQPSSHSQIRMIRGGLSSQTTNQQWITSKYSSPTTWETQKQIEE